MCVVCLGKYKYDLFAWYEDMPISHHRQTPDIQKMKSFHFCIWYVWHEHLMGWPVTAHCQMERACSTGYTPRITSTFHHILVNCEAAIYRINLIAGQLI